MAVFGIPVARDNEGQIGLDAVNAVECALAMRETLDGLNRNWLAQGRPTTKMRVGIHTGTLVVGCLGGAERLEYTVIGDTVNTASRLESFDKTVDADSTCRILVSEETRRYLEGRIMTERLATFPLKGKKEPVTLYRVLGAQRSNGDFPHDGGEP